MRTPAADAERPGPADSAAPTAAREHAHGGREPAEGVGVGGAGSRLGRSASGGRPRHGRTGAAPQDLVLVLAASAKGTPVLAAVPLALTLATLLLGLHALPLVLDQTQLSSVLRAIHDSALPQGDSPRGPQNVSLPGAVAPAMPRQASVAGPNSPSSPYCAAGAPCSTATPGARPEGSPVAKLSQFTTSPPAQGPGDVSSASSVAQGSGAVPDAPPVLSSLEVELQLLRQRGGESSAQAVPRVPAQSANVGTSKADVSKSSTHASGPHHGAGTASRTPLQSLKTHASFGSNDPLDNIALPWVPRPDKFLLAHCFHGMLSNRLQCLRNHALLAGLLNRTLLVPYSAQEQKLMTYDLRLVWDLNRTRGCLGPNTVMTMDEYRRRYLARNVAPSASAGTRHGPKGGAAPGATYKGPQSIAVHCWAGPSDLCDGKGVMGNPLFCPLEVDEAATPAKQAGRGPRLLFRSYQLIVQGKPLQHQLFPPGVAPSVSLKAHCLDHIQYASRLVHAWYHVPHDILFVGNIQGKTLRHWLLEHENRNHPFIPVPGGAPPMHPAPQQGDTNEARGVGLSAQPLRPVQAQPWAGGGSGATFARAAAVPLRQAVLAGPDQPTPGGAFPGLAHAGGQSGPGGETYDSKGLATAGGGGQGGGVGLQQCAWALLRPHPLLMQGAQAVIRAWEAQGEGSSGPHVTQGSKNAAEGQTGQGAGDPEAQMPGFGDGAAALPALRMHTDGAGRGMRLGEEARGNQVGGGSRAGGEGMGKYMAVHWRRGDFVEYCNKDLQSFACTYGPTQAAQCIAKKALAHGISKVFLATNAALSEVDALKRHLANFSGGTVQTRLLADWGPAASRPLVPPVRGPGRNMSLHMEVEQMTLEKLLAAGAAVFVGSVRSTFSRGIEQMRQSLGTTSSADSLLCNGERETSDEALPEDVVMERQIRRVMARYGHEQGLPWQEQAVRQSAAKIMRFLERICHFKKSEVPDWVAQDSNWNAWKQGFATRPRLAPPERTLRQFLVDYARDLEERLWSGECARRGEGGPTGS